LLILDGPLPVGLKLVAVFRAPFSHEAVCPTGQCTGENLSRRDCDLALSPP
jgi:hypothetical protein